MGNVEINETLWRILTSKKQKWPFIQGVMIMKWYLWICLILLCNSCQEVKIDNSSANSVTTSSEEAVEKRAEEYLNCLRNKNWEGSAKLILIALPDSTKGPYRKKYIPYNELTQKKLSAEVIRKLKLTYGTVSPGSIQSIRLTQKEGSVTNPDPGPWANISYRHGDLDGFTMRYFRNNWYTIMELYPSIIK